MKMSELELWWSTWRDLTVLSGKRELQKWAFSKPVPVLDGGNWGLCPGSSCLGVPAPWRDCPFPTLQELKPALWAGHSELGWRPALPPNL